MSLVETRGTPERFAIRELVGHRGGPFVVAYFNDVTDEATLARIYWGLPIDETAFAAIKRAMKERLTDG